MLCQSKAFCKWTMFLLAYNYELAQAYKTRLGILPWRKTFKFFDNSVRIVCGTILCSNFFCCFVFHGSATTHRVVRAPTGTHDVVFKTHNVSCVFLRICPRETLRTKDFQYYYNKKKRKTKSLFTFGFHSSMPSIGRQLMFD